MIRIKHPLLGGPWHRPLPGERSSWWRAPSLEHALVPEHALSPGLTRNDIVWRALLADTGPRPASITVKRLQSITLASRIAVACVSKMKPASITGIARALVNAPIQRSRKRSRKVMPFFRPGFIVAIAESCQFKSLHPLPPFFISSEQPVCILFFVIFQRISWIYRQNSHWVSKCSFWCLNLLLFVLCVFLLECFNCNDRLDFLTVSLLPSLNWTWILFIFTS